VWKSPAHRRLREFGLDAIAQVDLQERVHHNQPLESLSKMSFAIIQTVVRRIEKRYGIKMLEDVTRTMKLIRYGQQRLQLDVDEIAELERIPMIEVPEYREPTRRNAPTRLVKSGGSGVMSARMCRLVA